MTVWRLRCAPWRRGEGARLGAAEACALAGRASRRAGGGRACGEARALYAILAPKCVYLFLAS